MKILDIDIETFSDIDLKSSGLYAYVDSPYFEILLFSYAFEGDAVKEVDVASGEELPDIVLNALTDDRVIKTAFNAAFERTCIAKYYNLTLHPSAWHCTAAQAAILSLPGSLERVGEVLNIEKKKLREGESLIKYFTMPCKPTKTNGWRTRNIPADDPEKWEMFKRYCIRDVEVEREIRYKLRNYPIPKSEQTLYILDQEVNDRGILVDMDIVRNAISCDNEFRAEALKRAYELTGLDNPNSPAQIKAWLNDNGVQVDSLSAKTVATLAKDAEGDALEILKIRQDLAKTSVKKYEAISRAVCSDGRIHGLLQFYGASRTGRWAGKLVQVHNLPGNHLQDLELARNILKSGDYESLSLLYDSIPGVLSELIRTALIPKEGCRFIVSDFSAIEARILAWLAGERWRLDTFRQGRDIYCESASRMFGVPVEKGGVNSELRPKGKIAELALGYGGSTGALISMGALDMGLSEDELPALVSQWRKANPRVVRLWREIENSSIKAVREHTTVNCGRITFSYRSGILFVILPSGRRLSYIRPKIERNRFGRPAITFEGVDTARKWSRIETYGAKLTENIVQATARDILAQAMLRLRDAGLDIVMHVHDEVVLEVPEGVSSTSEVCHLLSETPEWAEGLPLNAEGYECSFYHKE